MRLEATSLGLFDLAGEFAGSGVRGRISSSVSVQKMDLIDRTALGDLRCRRFGQSVVH